MLYANPSVTPWNSTRWPDFVAREIACKQGLCPYCKGEVFVDEHALDCLQTMRTAINAPLQLIRGHSCVRHNAEVGGARMSAHLQLAFDIGLGNHNRVDLAKVAMASGFQHFGFMKYGLHVDTRAANAAAHYWSYGETSRNLWYDSWLTLGIDKNNVKDIGGV